MEEKIPIDIGACFLSRAISEFDRGKYVKAIEMAKTAISFGADNILSLRLMGDSYFFQDRVEDAVFCLELCVSLNPYSRESSSSLFLYYLCQKRYSDAWGEMFRMLSLTDTDIYDDYLGGVVQVLKCADDVHALKMKVRSGDFSSWDVVKGEFLSRL